MLHGGKHAIAVDVHLQGAQLLGQFPHGEVWRDSLTHRDRHVGMPSAQPRDRGHRGLDRREHRGIKLVVQFQQRDLFSQPTSRNLLEESVPRTSKEPVALCHGDRRDGVEPA